MNAVKVKLFDIKHVEDRSCWAASFWLSWLK